MKTIVFIFHASFHYTIQNRHIMDIVVLVKYISTQLEEKHKLKVQSQNIYILPIKNDKLGFFPKIMSCH